MSTDTPAATPTRRLADALLDGGLEEYVRVRRLSRKSWRAISLNLHDDIAVDISFETLRNWFNDREWAVHHTAQHRHGLGTFQAKAS